MIGFKEYSFLIEAMNGSVKLTKEQHDELKKRMEQKVNSDKHSTFEKQIFNNVLKALKSQYPEYSN